MCWVIPPASPAATSVSRIASSSEVLPWSTWPMIVTTGARSTRSSSASSNTGSAIVLVLGVDDLHLLAELGGQHLDRLVRQRLGERLHLAQRHQLLHHLGHRDVEVLGDVLDGRAGVDLDRARVGDRRARGPRLGLLVVDAAPAPAAALAARRLVGLRRTAALERGARPGSRSRRGAGRRRCRGRARPGGSHGWGAPAWERSRHRPAQRGTRSRLPRRVRSGLGRPAAAVVRCGRRGVRGAERPRPPSRGAPPLPVARRCRRRRR